MNRIRKISSDHPIWAHLLGYALLGVVLTALDFYINGVIGPFRFFMPCILFLGWLFESYYRVSLKKLWLMYFLILFIFLTVTDIQGWVDWTSSLVQMGISAFLASIFVLIPWRERSK